MPVFDLILILALIVVGAFAFTLLQRINRLGEVNKADLEAARREAAQMLEAAKAEAKTLIESARAEARAIREGAQSEVRALREAAQSDADRIRLNTQAEVERLRRESEERLRTQTKEERERMLTTLAAERETLTAERNSVKAERERLQSDLAAVRAEREELKRETERLARRGEQLDARALRLDEQEEKLDGFEKGLEAREAELAQRERSIDLKLQEVAGMSREEARSLLLSRLEAELEEEKALKVKANLERVRLEVKREAQKLIAQAAQRQASETAASLAVSVVPIPSDAMKGRIIGREGRNIRTFEALTGVDLIIDDTPEAVLLSGFNPVRREIARMALEQLVADGRIHPSRIEEVVEKAKNEMKTFIYERGEEAALEAGVVGLKPGLVQLLGRLHFRSSYGQNVLKHSIQVAHLTGIMAAELGLDAALGRRAGLLHDIGKSVDREIEGTHVEIGVTLASRFGEPKEVIDAIAHHHDPENNETVYSVLAAAADAISAARPGARRESLEEYIQRLEQLERIALSFPGVDNAFAVQAGREVRVIVKPDRISDSKATLLAREIAGRIERDMNYPGQVQVTVVRESRAVEYAK
ncbi:ribonuclease Y [Meiothermus granaticius]|uniref:Ribonuclease Y n=1 Tax=Meiothermus granaticius NBRC 107808 TaxID=1227551 RepID=A0A399F8Q8_9DEIN|nr:ribonuclease Y [Meiothermus granaticius]RIH91021.1 Ribonuclease Y [Meiothermus granaticius NBRC 107808]GEM88318.1 ribonuclease Y [Meiothermus granaticius NBRC 107808]